MQQINSSNNTNSVNAHEYFERVIREIYLNLKKHGFKSSRVFKVKGSYKSLPIENIIAEAGSLDIYLEYIKNTVTISQEQGLWKIFNLMGVTPHNDYLMLENKSHSQFFNKYGVMLFQTFDMYEYISYTYEDLILCSWPTLFTRDESITNYLISCAKSLVETGEPVKVNSGFHLVKEIHSEQKTAILLNVKDVYPLYTRGTTNLVGYVATNDVQLADS